MIKGLFEFDDSSHPEDVKEIIKDVPSWLLRWGSLIFLGILISLLIISFLLKYPETIKTQLIINLENSPKAIVPKISGKLTKLLVFDNQRVQSGEPLAYLESTADYRQVLSLIGNLEKAQKLELTNSSIDDLFNDQGKFSNLGELQEQYQAFYQAFLKYHMTIKSGLYSKRKNYLLNDLKNIEEQRKTLNEQKKLQTRDYDLASDEFKMHKNLAEIKVETRAEFREQESKYLSKKSPLIQTDESLLSVSANHLAKQKEITELENQILEDKMNFLQALNSLLSRGNEWKSKYVLTASESGAIVFVGFIQVNQILNAGQEIFYINPGKARFFGEMRMPQNNMGKILVGQTVLVKLRSFPFEEYGILRGKVTYISNLPLKDSMFVSKVGFILSPESKNNIIPYLKPGMIGDAEVITEDVSIFKRLTRSIIRMSR